MSMRRWLLFCVLIGVVAIADRPRAQGPVAAFYGVGDLPGGRVQSVIKDATRAAGVIYAVGGGVARDCGLTTPPFCSETDTAILWRFDGTNPATLEALPALPLGVTNTTATSPLTAYAITPDAAFIAGHARNAASPSGSRRAVRVTRSSLSNLELNPVPGANNNVAAAISGDDGTILYGFNSVNRGLRFDTVSTTTVFLQTLPAGVQDPVAERGTSANGNVVVGSRFSTVADHIAYRYVHGSGVTHVPLLNGGTFNDAVAVSPDGDLVLVTGNSAANPNGEAYLYRASTGAIQPLGSPNTAWGPGARSCANNVCTPPALTGGMTADGSVVAMSFYGADGQTRVLS